MSRVASTPWLLEAINHIEQTGEEAQKSDWGRARIDRRGKGAADGWCARFGDRR